MNQAHRALPGLSSDRIFPEILKQEVSEHLCDKRQLLVRAADEADRPDDFRLAYLDHEAAEA